MRKKVVITGGAGFIGSHIAEYWLSEGADVHIIDNLRSGNLNNIEINKGAHFHRGSITDKELVDSVLKNSDSLKTLLSFPLISHLLYYLGPVVHLQPFFHLCIK